MSLVIGAHERYILRCMRASMVANPKKYERHRAERRKLAPPPRWQGVRRG